jgi:hypothetical protein
MPRSDSATCIPSSDVSSAIGSTAVEECAPLRRKAQEDAPATVAPAAMWSLETASTPWARIAALT